jgi:hypothetical protein
MKPTAFGASAHRKIQVRVNRYNLPMQVVEALGAEDIHLDLAVAFHGGHKILSGSVLAVVEGSSRDRIEASLSQQVCQ